MAKKLPASIPQDTATWRRLAVAFYARVDNDPLLRPLFPGTSLRCAIEAFTAFLAQIFEGPESDTQFRWWLSLRESHLRFRIRNIEKAAWMANMVQALDDAQIEEPLRGALGEFFERSSAYLVNSGTPTPAAVDQGEPSGDGIRQRIARCWEAQCRLDEAVAAVRAGDADRAIAMAESLRNGYRSNRSVLAGLLALMMGSRKPAMLRYVEERVTLDPAFVRERYAGRTLLHAASAHGNLAMVQLLLRLGADPNAQDGGSHAPLYSLANEYKGPDGGDVVRALARGGARVNASDGAKHCTALHMAARRGNLEIARVLLDCGAKIDARDSLGDTPLRRAVNCGQLQIASLLLAAGADMHSPGSKGLTPLQAARTGAMKKILNGS
jgi:hemoglobin